MNHIEKPICKKTLPYKYQTNMSVLQGIVLSTLTKLDYATQHLSILISLKQGQVWDRCQQIDHTISIVRLSPRIVPSGIYMQLQYLRMYYIQLAVSREKRMTVNEQAMSHRKNQNKQHNSIKNIGSSFTSEKKKLI